MGKKFNELSEIEKLDIRQKQTIDYFERSIKLLSKCGNFRLAGNFQEIQKMIELGHSHIRSLQKYLDHKKE